MPKAKKRPLHAYVPLGAYSPRIGPLHHKRAELKLLVLVIGITAIAILAKTPLSAAIAALAVAAAYVFARVPAALALKQLAPTLPLLSLLAIFHGWIHGATSGVVLLVMLASSIMAAALFTLTTTIAELMEGIERALKPVQRWGVPTEKISVQLALTIRLIPLQAAALSTVLEARRARGVGFGLRGILTPLIVRSIARAEAIAEALWARGVGNED